MSTQNQQTAAYETSNNQFIQCTQMTLEEIQNGIIEKIAAIRKIHLLIGFSEASLATQMDKNRECAKQLYHFEWNGRAEDFFAEEIITDMEVREKVIDGLSHKIQKLRVHLFECTKVLKIYLTYKQSLIKTNDECNEL